MTPFISLADECEVITKGTTPTTLGFTFEETGVPFIRVQNLVDGTVSISAAPLFISTDTHAALKRSQIESQDILISIAGTIGRAAIVPSAAGPMNCNQAVAIVRPTKRIDRRFMLHWLATADAMRQMAMGKVTGTISNLSLEQIGNLKVPLPQLNEQRRIAAILDKADALRRKRHRAIGLLESLTNSIFMERFGDLIGSNKYSRGTIADWVEDFDTGKNLAPDPDARTTGGYRVLKVSAVTKGIFLPDEAKPLPENYEPPTAHLVHTGDLLFSRANTAELVGATAYVESECDDLVLPDKIWRFVWRKNNPPNPRFVHALFSTPPFRRELSKRATGTSGSMKNISKDKVLSIGVALPRRDEQEEFVSKQDALRGVMRSAVLQARLIEEQFSSLQHRAFSGQL